MIGAPRAGGAAVLALAAGIALPGFAPGSAPAECPAPGSRVEAAGRTVEVGCGLPETPLAGATRLLYGLRLDPNAASAAALEVLPQIGPARARAFVEARAKSPFCGPEDLERVAGIGPNRAKALEPWLDFARAAGCTDAPPGRKKRSCVRSSTVRR